MFLRVCCHITLFGNIFKIFKKIGSEREKQTLNLWQGIAIVGSH